MNVKAVVTVTPAPKRRNTLHSAIVCLTSLLVFGEGPLCSGVDLAPSHRGTRPVAGKEQVSEADRISRRKAYAVRTACARHGTRTQSGAAIIRIITLPRAVRGRPLNHTHTRTRLRPPEAAHLLMGIWRGCAFVSLRPHLLPRKSALSRTESAAAHRRCSARGMSMNSCNSPGNSLRLLWCRLERTSLRY